MSNWLKDVKTSFELSAQHLAHKEADAALLMAYTALERMVRGESSRMDRPEFLETLGTMLHLDSRISVRDVLTIFKNFWIPARDGILHSATNIDLHDAHDLLKGCERLLRYRFAVSISRRARDLLDNYPGWLWFSAPRPGSLTLPNVSAIAFSRDSVGQLSLFRPSDSVPILQTHDSLVLADEVGDWGLLVETNAVSPDLAPGILKPFASRFDPRLDASAPHNTRFLGSQRVALQVNIPGAVWEEIAQGDYEIQLDERRRAATFYRDFFSAILRHYSVGTAWRVALLVWKIQSRPIGASYRKILFLCRKETYPLLRCILYWMWCEIDDPQWVSSAPLTGAHRDNADTPGRVMTNLAKDLRRSTKSAAQHLDHKETAAAVLKACSTLERAASSSSPPYEVNYLERRALLNSLHIVLNAHDTSSVTNRMDMLRYFFFPTRDGIVHSALGTESCDARDWLKACEQILDYELRSVRGRWKSELRRYPGYLWFSTHRRTDTGEHVVNVPDVGSLTYSEYHLNHVSLFAPSASIPTRERDTMALWTDPARQWGLLVHEEANISRQPLGDLVQIIMRALNELPPRRNPCSEQLGSQRIALDVRLRRGTGDAVEEELVNEHLREFFTATLTHYQGGVWRVGVIAWHAGKHDRRMVFLCRKARYPQLRVLLYWIWCTLEDPEWFDYGRRIHGGPNGILTGRCRSWNE